MDGLPQPDRYLRKRCCLQVPVDGPICNRIVIPAYNGSPRPSQWPPGCPSSPYWLCALVGSSSADSCELERSCEHFIHTSNPPSQGLSGGNFPIFRPLVGLPTGYAASGPSDRTSRR